VRVRSAVLRLRGAMVAEQGNSGGGAEIVGVVAVVGVVLTVEVMVVFVSVSV
jgi:hypothetical protein